jgi:hypothetical protein
VGVGNGGPHISHDKVSDAAPECRDPSVHCVAHVGAPADAVAEVGERLVESAEYQTDVGQRRQHDGHADDIVAVAADAQAGLEVLQRVGPLFQTDEGAPDVEQGIPTRPSALRSALPPHSTTCSIV